MAKKKHIIAVFPISDNVPQFINDVNALEESLTTPPGNTYVTVPPVDLTKLQTDRDELVTAQAIAESGEDGTAAQRDIVLNKVILDVRGLVMLVQAKADQAADELTSIAIIESCGMRVKNRGVIIKPDFAVKNDKAITGLLHLTSRAALRGLKAIYEWQYSLNGINFTTIKSTTQSRTSWLSGLAQGTKVILRKRVTTNKDTAAPAWSYSITVYIL